MNPFGKPRRFHKIRALAASESTFRDFSSGVPRPAEPFDILIHARATNKCGQDHKNWPVNSWERLIAALPANLRVASIGDPNGAHKISGTEDLRGLSLDRLAAHCGSARMLIGPSSGPVHFAMHCGLPALTWMGEHRHHYYPQWNPLNVPVVCFDTWQPHVETVLARVRDLYEIASASHSPVRYLVVATQKRSGHHAVTEWMMNLDPSKRQIWLNDCVSRNLSTPPYCKSSVPTSRLLPKQIGEALPRDLVTVSGNERFTSERIYSVEGAPLSNIACLPEAKEARQIVFVLRDALNVAASYRLAFQKEFSKQGFLGEIVSAAITTYRDYLYEALGRTCILGDLRSKAIFVSYNRWHIDTVYRREISRILGCELADAERGIVSAFGPRSAFQSEKTPAHELRTLDRWRDAIDNHELQAIWTAARDAELVRAEREFHGSTIALTDIEEAWK
jgi:hypothetical protein